MNRLALAIVASVLTFVAQGWIFFMPYRRGQGLNERIGAYIGTELQAARRRGNTRAAGIRLVELMQGEHLQDQLAALAWLRGQPFVQPARIATAGNSFGGIQTVFGVANVDYCAGVDAADAAESWAQSPELQQAMKEAVRAARAPIFFFQSQNDYNVAPSVMLSSEMTAAGKTNRLSLYPPYGNSERDGHSFPYRSTDWFEDVFPFIERSCAK
jgi:dienelactone hydrolase